MRWMVSLVVPLLLLPLVPTHSWAQEPPPPEPVPITITFPESNHDIAGVAFPAVKDTIFEPVPGMRMQFRVRPDLEYDPETGRYQLWIRYFRGRLPESRTTRRQDVGAQFDDTVSFAAQRTCGSTPLDGELIRIACSVVENGSSIACEGFYNGMESPPDVCEGTQACIKCRSIRVCGSDPQCN
jgi:hypothetical protein